MLLRAFLVLGLIALAEVGQGILRVRFLNRRVGNQRASQIGVATGSVLIVLIAWLTLRWVGPGTRRDCLAIGTLWVVGMVAVDVFFGRIVFHAPWDRIAASFDPRRGGFLAFGVLVLFLSPLLLAQMLNLL